MDQLETSLAAAFVLAALLFLAKFLRPDPLKQYPGPTLARHTWLYRAYYDIIVGGGWLSHLQDLHEEYGPIVRIGRNELHFTDPAAYADIYNSSYKMTKDPNLYSNAFQFGLPLNVFAVSNPKDHSALKSLFSSYFSRKVILKLEDIIQERVDRLVSQLTRNHKSSPANMNRAFRSVTLDVITVYTLRTSSDTTSFPSFEHPAILAMHETTSIVWIMRHLTYLQRLATSIPHWLAVYLSPAAKPSLEVQEDVKKLVDSAIADSRQYEGGDEADDLNVFYTILRNSRIDGKVKQSSWVTRDQMIAEAMGFRFAGSDTVGNACTIGTRHLIRETRVREKLVQELGTAWPDRDSTMPLERLEKLPYLTAVIKESLRLSFGVVTPMPRVVPESGAVIAGYPVPPGTIVSIGNTFVHMNRDIFPDPSRFHPERWLEDHTLDRYLVAFGKGPRSCIGINLAWCELYLILGNVFRKLYFNSQSDLRSEVQLKEYFVPLYEGDVLSATVSERS